ncbi:poly(ADP-ribose) glycohydrolase-like [Neocloeon triangulifer]|uniref:poly(ADP-ribose) glycohydrolase-like n=1 Tax=Neocloeon triangulifer TaxID=2078957 RepID=UPI00286F6D67|nr:poly(ADP-ribose) glycohydrolase-like [Neocloeon triangulifer]
MSKRQSQSPKKTNYSQIGQSMASAWGDKLERGADLENFIKRQTVSHKTKKLGNMNVLVNTLDYQLDVAEKHIFFTQVFPQVVNVARFITSGPLCGLLDKFNTQTSELQLTRMEVACILSNAFLCTFPDTSEINFTELYSCRNGNDRSRVEMIKCIITYFNSIFVNFDQTFFQETVTFKKSTIENAPDWFGSEKPIIPFSIVPKGSISQAYNMAQVNFANKCIGGGVLEGLCLREEIWFITCPELIASKLFVKEMADNEAIIVEGVLQYADFDGTDAQSFTCKGPKSKDSIRGPHTVISMDALNFSSGCPNVTEQFAKKNVDRELNKAYAGFSGTKLGTIATGNWGSGCYMGNTILKAKIQMIAASEAKKALFYYSFYNDDVVEKLEEKILQKLEDENQSVGEAYRQLLTWCQSQEKKICYK